MSTGMIIFLVLLAAFVGYAIVIYNRMVAFRNRVKNGFAQIDVQLQRRYELIPNLVETAKTYLQHERETLTQVIEARNQAKAAEEKAASQPENAEAMRQLSQAEGGLSAALGKLFALNESYPDLKANQNMMQLTEELTTTENKVAFARQAYNDAVMSYNNKREVFPNNVVAGMFGFKEAALFEIDEPAQREAPEVSF
jgi:LemA protein